MIDLTALTFQWPAMLWLLTALPGLVALYAWLLGRGRRLRLAYAGLELSGGTGAAPARLRGHLPPLLMLLGLTALLFATARPQAPVTLPARQETVMLAMDVSGSMRATDLKPNRLTAAQEAAKAFITRQPRHVRIGIVAVAGAAAVVQSPTDNRDDLLQAIDRFQLQRGSAIGSGLVMALAALLPDAGIDVEQLTSSRGQRAWLREPSPKAKAHQPVAPGSNGSAVIVLLSDGESNTGFDPAKAAKLAADHGVRVFTVGMGTVAGTTLGFDGWSMRVRLNEALLKQIAITTHGDYFSAANTQELKSVYEHLTTRLVLEKKRSMEVTAAFVALGAGLALLSAVLSMFWYNRIL